MNPAVLLDQRVPRDHIIPGRAYLIHARNGIVGVAVQEDEARIGYTLHRVKFSAHYLDTETDWADCSMHGTAIPLRLLEELPLMEGLLQWLAQKEQEHGAEVQAIRAKALGGFWDAPEPSKLS